MNAPIVTKLDHIMNRSCCEVLRGIQEDGEVRVEESKYLYTTFYGTLGHIDMQCS